MQELRLRAARTACARAQVAWLRNRLFKLGAHVVGSVRRVVLHLPTATPDLHAWRHIALALGADRPQPALVSRAYTHPGAPSPPAAKPSLDSPYPGSPQRQSASIPPAPDEHDARRTTGVRADGAAGVGALSPGQRWSAGRKREVRMAGIKERLAPFTVFPVVHAAGGVAGPP